MTNSQDNRGPLLKPPMIIKSSASLIVIPPIYAEELAHIKKALDSESESEDRFGINSKSARNIEQTNNKDFQTKRVSEFAKSNYRQQTTVCNETFENKNPEDLPISKKSLFKPKDQKTLGIKIEGSLNEEGNERRLLKSADIRFISSTTGGFQDMFSDTNINSENMSESSEHKLKSSSKMKSSKVHLIKLLEEDRGVYFEESPDLNKQRPSVENEMMFPEKNTPKLLAKPPPLSSENIHFFPNNPEFMISTDKIPRSTNIMEESFIKPEEAKHERKNSNPHRSMSSMLRSNIVEKKEIIRKEDKAIKACLMLEEHLRQFNETEFSKFSMRTLQASQQLLNDVKTAIELPSLNLRQGQEHIKVLETLEFLEKMTVLGTQFLKHNRNSNRGVIHEKAEKSGKRSNIFSARMANSLMSLDKWQRSKADSFKSRDSKVVDSSQEKSKKTPPTLKMNENKQKSDESRSLMRPSLDEISQIQNTGLNQEDNINKFNFQITEKQNEEKNQTFENLKIIPPRSLIKQSQGLGHEDGIISFKKFNDYRHKLFFSLGEFQKSSHEQTNAK